MPARAAALAEWGALLGFLEIDVARLVEGLGRRLQPLMEQAPHMQAPGTGEPDGFAGIARGGDLSHLLLSEWLLADEEPVEFMRRFVMGELGYLLPERREPRSPARVVVLADAGPDQVGNPRLVHLAALAVLHRRAAADGATVSLGLLGSSPGRWVAGDLQGQLVAWRLARDSRRPSSDALRNWLLELAPDDRCWVIGAEAAIDAEPELESLRPIRRLGARELTWTAEGATRLDVEVDRRRISLEIPHAEAAVALLRSGGDTVNRGRRLATVAVPVRFPRFTASARRLLCRTNRADELMTIPIGRPGSEPPGIWRRYRFGGPVLAAGVFGRRTVALVYEGGVIRTSVLGRAHRGIESIVVSPDQLFLDRHSIEAQVAADLVPLQVGWEKIFVEFAGTWYSIAAPDVVIATPYTAVAPSQRHDVPRTSSWLPETVEEADAARERGRRRLVILGPGDTWAHATAEGYLLGDGDRTIGVVHLDPDASVIGIAMDPPRGGDPFLVVRSPGERLIRCQWPDRTQTLVDASGDLLDATIHPMEPILVVQHRDQTLEAFALPDGRSLGRLENATA